MAIYTLCSIVFHWNPKHPLLVSSLVISSIWLFAVLIVIVSTVTHEGKHYWGNTRICESLIE